MSVNLLVLKAAEYLDAIYDADECCRGQLEDWRTKINLDKLAMLSTTKCILGQLFGEYTTGVTTLCDWEYPAGVNTKSYGKVKYEDVAEAFSGYDKDWKELLGPKEKPSKYLKSKYGNTVFKVLAEVEVEGVMHYVTKVGDIQDGKFKERGSDNSPRLYPKGDFVDYLDWTPEEPKKFVKGRFYVSADRKFVGWMQTDTKMVAIIGGSGTSRFKVSYSDPEWYEGEHGKLTEVTQSGGGGSFDTITGFSYLRS